MGDTPLDVPEGAEPEDQDTDNVNVLDIILDEVRKVRETQEQQQRELEQIRGWLKGMTRDMGIVRAAQQEHGKKLGALESQCDRRRRSACIMGEEVELRSEREGGS